MRVGGEQDAAERMRVGARGGKMRRLAGAGQRQAGDDLEVRPASSPAWSRHCIGGACHRRKAVAQPKADVGRAGKPFPQMWPSKSAQPGAAAGSAAIDPEENHLLDHWLDTSAVAHYMYVLTTQVTASSRSSQHRVEPSPMDTERLSPRYADIDLWDPDDILEAMIEANSRPSPRCRPRAAQSSRRRSPWRPGCAMTAVSIYVGAGTSGRLAVQDGAELMPTFSWPRERLLMLLAGGDAAMTQAVEGAEDEAGHAARAHARTRIAPPTC